MVLCGTINGSSGIAFIGTFIFKSVYEIKKSKLYI